MQLVRNTLSHSGSSAGLLPYNGSSGAASLGPSSSSLIIAPAVVVEIGFQDFHDPEINRLYTASPPAADEMVSYNFERENKKKVLQ
jgi:hypothetical protein